MGIAANNVLLTDQISLQQVTIEAEVVQEENEDEETRVCFYSKLSYPSCPTILLNCIKIQYLVEANLNF